MTHDEDEEELAELFADPRESWDNLEIAVEFPGGYVSVHWTGFDEDHEAVSEGFLLRMGGESPLGDVDCPEVVRLLDGGSEPFEATARHLLRAEDARWLAAQIRRRERPTRWPDGRPLVWSESVVDEDPWRAVGLLEEPYEEGSVAMVCDSVTVDEPEEPAWRGQLQLVVKRALTDAEAQALPRTALWPVLRELHDVKEGRWLRLLAAHPMPWLRSLIVTGEELAGLAEAVGRLPRLRELLVYARTEAVPAISSESLTMLLLEGMEGPAIAAFVGGSRLPALQVLALYGEALAVPLDVTGLAAGLVVHVELMETESLEVLRNSRGVPTLALALKREHPAADLVRELPARAGLTTRVSTLWAHAEEAVALARAAGLELEAR